MLDPDLVKKGIRKEIWHGWQYAAQHRDEFDERKTEIVSSVHKMLSELRIFITDPGAQPRIHERLESAILNNLYQQPSPFCDIPDRGMQLSPRRRTEDAMGVKHIYWERIHGLADIKEI